MEKVTCVGKETLSPKTSLAGKKKVDFNMNTSTSFIWVITPLTLAFASEIEQPLLPSERKTSIFLAEVSY